MCPPKINSRKLPLNEKISKSRFVRDFLLIDIMKWREGLGNIKCHNCGESPALWAVTSYTINLTKIVCENCHYRLYDDCHSIVSIVY